jgi:hypothetical protein
VYRASYSKFKALEKIAGKSCKGSWMYCVHQFMTMCIKKVKVEEDNGTALACYTEKQDSSKMNCAGGIPRLINARSSQKDNIIQP